MKVALFSTYSDGGAGIAAVRLHRGLGKVGVDSTFFYKWNNKVIEHGKQIVSAEVQNQVFEEYVRENFMENIQAGNTICSLMYPAIGLRFLQDVLNYDLYHFHWIPSFISMEALLKISAWGKPMVWTLHDQNPMTAVCHYAGDCKQYQQECAHCPQMRDSATDLVQEMFKVKFNAMPKQMVVVSPSKWLADCAKKSKIFRDKRIEVIENGLDLSVYEPKNRNQARTYFQLPEGAKVILFGANDLKEKRKGMHLLLEAVQEIKSQPAYAALIARQAIWILTFGYDSPVLDQMQIPYKAVGYTECEEILAMAYSAADVVALPSLEDNLPNIMLEGMACGTPIVSFSIGGMKDVIEDGVNGYLVPKEDYRAFAKALFIAMDSGDLLRRSCREFAQRRFADEIQAEKYKALYQELLDESGAYVQEEKVVPDIFATMGKYMLPDLGRHIVSFQQKYNDVYEEKQRVEVKLNRQVEERNQLFHECNRLKAECENIERMKSRFELESQQLREILGQHENEIRKICNEKERIWKELQDVYQSRSWKWAMRLKKCAKIMGMK